VQENKWRKYSAPKGVVTPKGRRSHTAIVFQESMYIYGGYQASRIYIMINIKQIAGQRYSNSDDDLLLELLFENYYSMVRTSVARLPSSGLSIFPARPGTWCPRAALWTVLPPVTGTAFAHFLLSGGKTGFC
jgi:hypothetical protein